MAYSYRRVFRSVLLVVSLSTAAPAVAWGQNGSFELARAPGDAPLPLGQLLDDQLAPIGPVLSGTTTWFPDPGATLDARFEMASRVDDEAIRSTLEIALNARAAFKLVEAQAEAAYAHDSVEVSRRERSALRYTVTARQTFGSEIFAPTAPQSKSPLLSQYVRARCYGAELRLVFDLYSTDHAIATSTIENVRSALAMSYKSVGGKLELTLADSTRATAMLSKFQVSLSVEVRGGMGLPGLGGTIVISDVGTLSRVLEQVAIYLQALPPPDQLAPTMSLLGYQLVPLRPRPFLDPPRSLVASDALSRLSFVMKRAQAVTAARRAHMQGRADYWLVQKHGAELLDTLDAWAKELDSHTASLYKALEMVYDAAAPVPTLLRLDPALVRNTSTVVPPKGVLVKLERLTVKQRAAGGLPRPGTADRKFLFWVRVQPRVGPPAGLLWDGRVARGEALKRLSWGDLHVLLEIDPGVVDASLASPVPVGTQLQQHVVGQGVLVLGPDADMQVNARLEFGEHDNSSSELHHVGNVRESLPITLSLTDHRGFDYDLHFSLTPIWRLSQLGE